MQKRVLGKGLDALIPGNVPAETNDREQISEVDIFLIDNNPEQPRQNFDEEKLNELAQSIRTHGIIEPIIVTSTGGRYMIIAGERRFRAAKLANLDKVPVIVRNYEDQDKLELALIENVQREDLNPIEQAKALKTLVEKYNLTQQVLSERIGKNRSTLANLMRLLELPDSVKDMVEKGELSGGHARAILSLSSVADPDLIEKTAIKAAQQGWSVRDTESNVKNMLNAPSKSDKGEKADNKTETSHGGEFAYAEEKLSQALETKVQIKGNDNKGKIIIEYYSHEQLEQIYDALNALL